MGHEAERDIRPPSVDALARSLADECELPHAVLVDIARAAIATGDINSVAARARFAAVDFADLLFGEVVNASGVLLHTNLGRAPIAGMHGTRAVNVEYDVVEGRRGSRHDPIERLIEMLTGAEAAVVVNNNAAAVLLVLTALADGRGVAVSRGESVEIGGGFRVPEVMARSGARLVDVGTTNRTRLADYRSVVEDRELDVALVMRVHPSNFSINGFVESTPLAELATLGVPVIADLGSGLLDATAPWLPSSMRPLPGWISGEPAARQAIDEGADVVTFSGDKLLGGPQCGIIAGRRALVERCAAHPLMRALRPGHHALVPLQEVLLSYLRRDVVDVVPFWAMVARPVADLAARAEAIMHDAQVGDVVSSEAVVGAGAAPDAVIQSVAVAIDGDWHGVLRRHRPVPIIGRVVDGRTLLDLRAVDPSDDVVLIDALRSLGR